MSEHPDAIYPIIWSSDVGLARARRRITGSRVEAADLIAGVHALLLRYSGSHHRVVEVGTAGGRDRTSIAPDPTSLGPRAELTLGDCRAAVRRAWSPPGASPEPDSLVISAGSDGTDRVVFSFAREVRGGWSVEVVADTVPTVPDALERLAEHVSVFLEAGDATGVYEVEYLTEAELSVILDVNDTGRELPSESCVHHLVEEAVDRSPEHVAVIQGNHHLTYRELDEKANALALSLMERGIGIGRRVGIISHRSAEFVVAALAVMKSGAAYVPLDPTLPEQRRRILYRLGEVDVLIADEDYRNVAAQHADDWIALGRASAMPVLPRAGLTASDVQGRNLAYVIFTSGSSGEPKGALLDHIGRVNMITDLNERFSLTEHDRVLVVSSPSFDMSVYDIFGSLAAGATVVLPSRDREHDIDHWADLAGERAVTVWHSVPSSLSLFLNSWGERTGGIFRLFLLGGDWIPLGQPDAVWHRFPGARVVSLGGATEVSVDTVVFDIESVDPDWRSIPYGTPLANQNAYIVDESGMLAAIDQVGELCLGGIGVGWGYQSRAAFTAERFVPRPFGGARGERLYRTGDMARMRPNGVVELLGRIDAQVKVGGVRIELGEIQACVRSHPDVEDSVVVPVRDNDGAIRSLTTFLVRRPGAEGTEQRLRESVRAHLLDQLPSSMVPARMSVIDRLPVNANGKVDRRLLVATATAHRGDDPSEPKDGTMLETVARVWQQVLGLDSTPLPENSFYELGGSSLAAIQVVNRVNRLFDKEVRLRDLVKADTVAQVCAVIDAAPPRTNRRPALVPRSRQE